MTVFTVFMPPSVAPLVPEMISSASGPPNRFDQLVCRILWYVVTIERAPGMQQAAETRVAAPKLKTKGPGTT